MIELQPFTENDFDRLIQWIPDAKFMLQWAGPEYQWPLDMAQLLKSYAKTKIDPPAYYMFKAYDTEIDQYIGHIELMKVDSEKKSAHVGRVLIGPAFQGKGYCIRLMNKVCEFAFISLKLSTLTLGVFDFNKSAMACYQKTGFKITETKNAFREFENEKWNLVRMQLEKQKIY